MSEHGIRMLDELGAEFARVAREQRRPAGRRRIGVLAISAALLLIGGAYAVPGTRAAIDDITASFAGWVGGDEEQAPGQALRPGDDAPDWVRGEGSTRLIAENGGVALYVQRVETDDGVQLDFALDGAMGMSAGVEWWRERFDEHAIFPLGPVPAGGGGKKGMFDEDGRFALLGVTARSVERVKLTYEHGPPLVTDGVRGGFVLLADGRRYLGELIAYDHAGQELERVDVSDISDWRSRCNDPRGCPPGSWVRDLPASYAPSP